MQRELMQYLISKPVDLTRPIDVAEVTLVQKENTEEI